MKRPKCSQYNLFTNIDDVDLILDSQAVIRSATANCMALLGVETGALVGSCFWDLIHTADKHHIMTTFKQILAHQGLGEKPQLRLNLNSEHDVWVELHLKNLIDDKEVQGVLVTVCNITDQKKAQANHEVMVARYNKLISKVPIGMYILWIRKNGQKQFEFVSDRWCQIHQVKREDVLQDVMNVDNQVHPDERVEFDKRNRQSYLETKKFYWEGRFLTSDGSLRWLRLESTPEVSETQ